MSDFKARIIAELDTSQVEQKISELDGKKVKFGVDSGNAQKDVEKVDNSIKSATKSTKTFGDTLKTSAKLGAAYSITSQAFQAIREAASKAKEAVQDFDAAVMDLRMATGGTYTEVSNLVKEYNELGKAIGATTKEVSNGADSWLRQGHSIADTNTLIKDSMILSKVANLESAESTSFLTSIMKGFEIEVENVIGIIDKLVSVDMTSAVDAGGIAEGISKTAVSANTAGVSLDKLIGYLAATGEVTQESMSIIGNAFKTFFARYSAIKSGKLELIDEDGTIEVLSDVEQSLKNVGIDIRTTITDFDNAGDVLDNLAEKWDNLNSVQKSAIASAFGGTRQKERFLVLMENYSQATSYMETSMNSAGTAEQKFEAYLDSLEAKTKSLQAAFESLAINNISTETFGNVIDATTNLVAFIDETNLLKGSLAGLATGAAIKAFTAISSCILDASMRLNKFNSALNMVKNSNLGANEINQLAQMTNNLSQSQLKAVLSSKNLTTAQRLSILTSQGLSDAESKTALSTMGLATAEGAATSATNSFSGAMKGLWATIKANPTFIIITAITTAVSIFSTLKQKAEEAAEETKNAFQEASSELSSIESELKETKKRIEELQALDSLTLVEQNELESLEKANTKLEYQYKLKKQIADLAQQEAAKIANKELTKNTYWSTGQNSDVIDMTSYYISDKNKAEQNYYDAMKQSASEDTVKYFETTASNYEKLIANNLEIIDKYYSYLIDAEGDALPGYENTVSRIEAVIDATAESMSEVDTETQNVVDSLEDAENVAKSFSERISEVGNLSDGFDKLSNIYKDISDGGDFDVSSLFSKDFSEAFSGLGESYENFIKTVASSPNDIAACQSAFNDLATAYINNSDVLNGLTEDTKDTTIALLEQIGVTNAAEIVDRQLALEKARLSLETEAYVNKTYEEIIAEYKAAEAGSVAQQALAELALTKLNVNNAAINTSGDIEQVIALATAANATAASLQNLAKAKEYMALSERYKEKADNTSGRQAQRYESTSGFYLNEAQKLLNQPLKYEEIDSSKFKVNYTGGASSKGGSDSNSPKEPTSFDWIEIAIDRVENAIDKLKNTASSAYETIKTKVSGASDAISKISEEIKLQEKAYKRYMQEANAVGLSSDLAKKVQNGTIDINSYNEDTKKLIDSYKKWYDKAISCKDSIDGLHESLAGLYSEKFDILSQDFENQLSEIEHAVNSYDNKISEYEAKGYLNTKSFYQSLMEAEKKNLKLLKEQYSSLYQTLNEVVASGEIKEGSDAWHDMMSEINEVNEAIQESTLSTLEFANTIRNIDWEIFEFLQKQISQVNSEAEFLIELMSNDKLFDDKGKITDEGLATMGLHGASYNVYMRQADEYAIEIEKINAQLANDPANTELLEKKQEYIDLQKESILATEDEKRAIIDLVEEGFNLELDYLNELIDKYTDALDSAKDLYDYQKKISEYTDEISSLEKQLSAYSGDDSEESRLKIQELTKELKSTKDDLEEAEYDKYISDQKELLSDLYDTYEEILNKRLDNIDGLLKNIFDGINTNASIINNTLCDVAESVGMSLSDALSTMWNVDINSANGDVNSDGEITAADARLILRAAAGLETLEGDAAKNADVDSDGKITAADARLALRVAAGLDELPTNRVISIYGDDFSNKLTSVNSVLNTISENVKKITNDLREDVNKDGIVDKTDVQIVLEASANMGITNLAYDIDNDGEVTAKDAKLILEKQGIKAYKTGGLVDYTGLAKVDGTPSKPELVLNAEDAENFLDLKEYLRELAKQPLTIGDNSYSYNHDAVDVPQLTGVLDLSGKMSELRKTDEIHTNITNHYDIDIPIDHVQDYNDFMNQLKKDPKFEKMVQAATTDRLVGKSSLAKHKYSW